MTATPTEAPDLQAMVGPGQEDVLDQFLQELEQQDDPSAQQPQEEKLLAGKFKSTEDLEKAYLEAQKLIGSRQKPAETGEEKPAEPLSLEQATERYGELIATAADKEGLDLAAWDAAVRKGDDTKALRDKLSASTGIPTQLIEQYEKAFRPAPARPAEAKAQGLSDADVVELKQLVGGDQEFARLSKWASENLAAEELEDYNQAVEGGNKVAIRLALRSMQARSAMQGQEPDLIGGGKPARGDAFESQEQAIEAMRKTNSKGQNLYRADPKYREWFDKTLARSTFPS